jgi:hypothetical protein
MQIEQRLQWFLTAVSKVWASSSMEELRTFNPLIGVRSSGGLLKEKKGKPMKEFSVAHGYDGFSVHLYERAWYKVLAERLYSGLMKITFHPCCYRGAWKYIFFWENINPDKYAGRMSFWLMNNKLTNWYLRDRKIIHYPVHEDWVRENLPQMFEDPWWFPDDEKDPNYGTICPKCGKGRINDQPEQSIKKYGHCFRCEVAAKIVI